MRKYYIYIGSLLLVIAIVFNVKLYSEKGETERVEDENSKLITALNNCDWALRRANDTIKTANSRVEELKGYALTSSKLFNIAFSSLETFDTVENPCH